VLLRGVNDSPEDAERVAALDPDAFLVKIAALNEVAGAPHDFTGASQDEIRAFCRRLESRGMPHKIFVNDGLDVNASCGQLAAVPRESYG
jgi:adenine C2-methylase RlmN of 23S rRNA A2503 and tRNA A37